MPNYNYNYNYIYYRIVCITLSTTFELFQKLGWVFKANDYDEQWKINDTGPHFYKVMDMMKDKQYKNFHNQFKFSWS